MVERRRRRSVRTEEALGLLLESVALQSEISSIALIDSSGNIVGGCGVPAEISILRDVAPAVAAGKVTDDCLVRTEGTDVLARTVVVRGEAMTLAGLGTRIRKMPEAAQAIARILDAA